MLSSGSQAFPNGTWLITANEGESIFWPFAIPELTWKESPSSGTTFPMFHDWNVTCGAPFASFTRRNGDPLPAVTLIVSAADVIEKFTNQSLQPVTFTPAKAASFHPESVEPR